MRVFLSSFNDFSVAIPMKQVSSIFLHSGKITHTFEYNNEKGNSYISLPKLFKCRLEDTKHGVILKNSDNDDSDIIENKTILLTSKIECEMEIPDEEIFPVPKAFYLMRFSSFFSGLRFADGLGRKVSNNRAEDLVLFLNTENFVQKIQKEVSE